MLKNQKIKGLSLPMIIMLIIVAVLFGGIFIIKAYQNHQAEKNMQANQTPIITVSTVKATYSDWQYHVKATGSFTSVLGTDVTTEIAGLVKKIYFADGQSVKKNTLLVELNSSTEVANLHAQVAATDLAKITFDRDMAQYAVQAVSQQTIDTDRANLKSTRAQIEQTVSIINKKLIRAPFSGKLGISTINYGQYLNPGDKIAFSPIS